VRPLRAAILAFTMVLSIQSSAVLGTGLDQKITNDHPDRTWRDTVGGFFTFGKSVAVVVGISGYMGEDKGGYPELRSTAHDAEKMVRFLKDEAGFDIIYVLTDEKVTKDRIEQLMLDEVRIVVGPHDRFLFYWSGHGDQLVTDGKKHGFLPLVKSKHDEYSTMVSMGDIARWDTFLSAQQALFVLDSCLSGLAGTEVKGLHSNRLQQLSQSGHHLMTAGEAGENVIAGDKWTGSLFTDSFIKGAEGEAQSYDGVISLWSLLDYIQRRVTIEREAVAWRNQLTPQINFLTAGPGAFFFIPVIPVALRSSDKAVSPAGTSSSGPKGRTDDSGNLDLPSLREDPMETQGKTARSEPLVRQLAENIDFRNAVTNKDAISSLVGIAVTQGEGQQDAIVSLLIQKLQHPSTVQYDTLGRSVRKALIEAIVKIRHHDIRKDFLDGQLVNIDLVGADLSNVGAAGVKFTDAFLIGTGFQGADLRGSDFSSTSLRGVRFDNAQLNSASFAGGDWFNAGGLIATQLKTISPKELQPCPTDAKGKYSKSSFIKYANSHYGVHYEDWANDEQSDASRFWAEYSHPGGLCDIAKARH
jgi:Caspase domain/Pentapeptide repeats (8 copies)